MSVLQVSFAWEDQRQEQYCVSHKMSGVLQSNTVQRLANTVQLFNYGLQQLL